MKTGHMHARFLFWEVPAQGSCLFVVLKRL